MTSVAPWVSWSQGDLQWCIREYPDLFIVFRPNNISKRKTNSESPKKTRKELKGKIQTKKIVILCCLNIIIPQPSTTNHDLTCQVSTWHWFPKRRPWSYNNHLTSHSWYYLSAPISVPMFQIRLGTRWVSHWMTRTGASRSLWGASRRWRMWPTSRPALTDISTTPSSRTDTWPLRGE